MQDTCKKELLYNTKLDNFQIQIKNRSSKFSMAHGFGYFIQEKCTRTLKYISVHIIKYSCTEKNKNKFAV